MTHLVRALPPLGALGRALLLPALVVTLSDCSLTAGGPEYVEVSVSATEDGSVETVQRCTPLPVMPGGHAAQDLTFADAFHARVDATRDRVNITFVGINDPELANETISRESLENGFAITDLRIETIEGRRFTVVISSACPSSMTEP